ncbi:MAG: immunoglobulin [Clostridiales bacterium]|nr:immunoglobulin [Clostridiales bacterium]
MKLSKEEQETIICYNEAEQTASVYTHNRKLRNRLEQLAQERPDDCRLEQTGHSGEAVDYIIPKSWVKINAGPRLTAEQRAAKATLARNLHSQLKNDDTDR